MSLIARRFERLVSQVFARQSSLAMEGAIDERRWMASREARVLPRFERLVSQLRVLPRFERLVSQLLARTQRTMDDGWRAFSETYLMPRFGNGFNRGFNRFGRDWKQLVPRPPTISKPPKRYFRSETFRHWVHMADVTFGNIYFRHDYSGNWRLREVNVLRYFSPDTGNYPYYP